MESYLVEILYRSWISSPNCQPTFTVTVWTPSSKQPLKDNWCQLEIPLRSQTLVGIKKTFYLLLCSPCFCSLQFSLYIELLPRAVKFHLALNVAFPSAEYGWSKVCNKNWYLLAILSCPQDLRGKIIGVTTSDSQCACKSHKTYIRCGWVGGLVADICS